MSDTELLRLFRRASKDLDARQMAQIRALKGIERTLFEALITVLVDELTTKDGRITSAKGDLSLSKAIDRVFDALQRGEFVTFAKQSVLDFNAIIAGQGAYFLGINEAIAPGRYRGIERKVRQIMRARLGIGDGGSVIKDGYLDRLFTATTVREAVKQIIMRAVSGGLPMNKLVDRITEITKTSATGDSALMKYMQPFIFDTYQQFDRATGDQFAKRLDLQVGSYEGGLIETSRAFCVKHDGKIFTVQEAEAWRDDPDLPQTAQERKSGQVLDYVPTVDMGRWNCRHRFRYMSKEMAIRERPDLSAVL